MSGTPIDEYEKRYMDPGERVVFREKVVSRTAFRVSVIFGLVFGLVGLGLVGASAIGAMAAAGGFALGALSILFATMMGVLGVMFSVFRTMITTENVHVHFGWAKRKIPFSAIESVRSMTLSGFKQGKVSIGLDGVVRTWVGNSVSGRGVELTYREPGGRKHVMTIGSEDADRFAETVERARATTEQPSKKARIAESAEAGLAEDQHQDQDQDQHQGQERDDQRAAR
jgi:hypothetical protein